MDRPSNASLAQAAATPLPDNTDGSSLREPQPQFLESRTPSSLGPTGAESAIADSTTALGGKQEQSVSNEDPEVAAATEDKSGKKRTLILALAGLAALAVIVIAVVVPVYFKVIKKSNADTGSASAGSGSSHTGTAATPTSTAAARPTSGGNGSTVTLANGTTFTYVNPFGGICEYFS